MTEYFKTALLLTNLVFLKIEFESLFTQTELK